MTSGESSGPEMDDLENAEESTEQRVEVEINSEEIAVEEEVVEVDVESLQIQLAQAEREAAEATARAQAEVQNLRKRLERDKENAAKFALEKFAVELLNVSDSLEMALGTLDREDAAMTPAIEGTELTLKQLLEVFKKFSIVQLNPLGEPFDPEFHEALTMVPNPDMEPNTVMDVIQTGYTLHGRLIRAARVVVSKEA